ncbi:unnamed protein product, partial [marine sediment metagenome]
NVKRFYFSFNSRKINSPDLLDRQIRAATRYVLSRNNLNYQGLEIGTGYNREDFINNKATLSLCFNCI